MKYRVVNLSKQDYRVVIQFLGTEWCQPAEIHRWTNAIYGAACVSKIMMVDWLCMFWIGRQQMMDMPQMGLSQDKQNAMQ
jgi:hypothetical protein